MAITLFISRLRSFLTGAVGDTTPRVAVVGRPHPNLKREPCFVRESRTTRKTRHGASCSADLFANFLGRTLVLRLVKVPSRRT